MESLRSCSFHINENGRYSKQHIFDNVFYFQFMKAHSSVGYEKEKNHLLHEKQNTIVI